MKDNRFEEPTIRPKIIAHSPRATGPTLIATPRPASAHVGFQLSSSTGDIKKPPHRQYQPSVFKKAPSGDEATFKNCRPSCSCFGL